MNLNTLKTFRKPVYDCLEQRADALFSLCDGLLSSPQARTLPELSHSPFFGRKWPSIYAALADGKIKVDQLQALCVRRVVLATWDICSQNRKVALGYSLVFHIAFTKRGTAKKGEVKQSSAS